MEERDEYAEAHAGMVRAMTELRKVLAPIAAEHNANVDDVADAALLRFRDPDGFKRLHAAATQADEIAKATISNLEQKAQELHDALQRVHTSSPAEKAQAWHLLGKLRNQIEKMK